MKTLFSLLLACINIAPAIGQTTGSEIQRSKTSNGVEYGLWGKAKTKPAPVLFVLASTIDSTLGDPYYRQCGNELAELGYLCVSIDLPGHAKAALFKMDLADSTEYWMGLHDFYVITRYNHSSMYALAVHQLAQEIKKRRGSALAVNE